MTRGRHVSVDTDDIRDTLAELASADETIDGGGVMAKRLAADLPYHKATVLRELHRLEREGDVELVWGFTDSGPQKSFRLTDEDDSADDTRLIADGGRVTQVVYECEECDHRIKIYETDEQAVFCQCTDAGPQMNPIGPARDVAPADGSSTDGGER